MRKLVLVIGSLVSVVLLALLMYVADRDGGGVTYTGSYEQVKELPGDGTRHGDGHGKRHGERHGERHDGQRDHHKTRPKPPEVPEVPGVPPARDRPTFLDPTSLTCRFEGGQLVLGWTYGAGERVAPFVDARGEGLVVGVEVVKPGPDVMVPMIALTGEARFADFGRHAWVRNPDGTDLPCPGAPTP